MIFAKIGDGPCYYLWNEICAGVKGNLKMTDLSDLPDLLDLPDLTNLPLPAKTQCGFEENQLLFPFP